MKKILFLINAIAFASFVGATGSQEPSALWSYEVEVTREGSRSEGELGHLFFGERELEAVFDRVIVSGARYDWKQRNNLWDFGGYELQKNTSPVPKGIAPALSSEEQSAGWYEAPFEGYRLKTPDNWVWVSRDAFAAWVDPEHMNDLIETFRFSPRSTVKR